VLDFALTAPFVVLTLHAVRDLRGDLPTPLLALLCAPAARVLFPPQLLLAVTVGPHLWGRNALLSILAGTAVHVARAGTLCTARRGSGRCRRPAEPLAQPCLGAVGAVRRRVKEWPAGSA
jgi:hypothetical protein